jgi:hypothetical protein
MNVSIKNKFFQKLAFLLCLCYLAFVNSISAQAPIEFTKHSKMNNLFVGNKLGFELPVYVGGILTSDYEYEGADGKGITYFGISPKITLKNGWGRGIGLGVGFDYTTNGYFRANLLLDLDFLFAYDLQMNDKGMRFKPSMFTKFELTKIIAKHNGALINEYYLAFNIMKMQIGKIAGEMGYSIGILRDKYPPHFADKGLYYKLSYFVF